MVKPTAQQLPTSKKKAKPAPSKQIDASEIASLMDEPEERPRSVMSLPAEPPKGLKANGSDDMEDLLGQVLSDGPAEAPSSPQERVLEPWRPTYANPKDQEPVANPFADDGDD